MLIQKTAFSLLIVFMSPDNIRVYKSNSLEILHYIAYIIFFIIEAKF